MKAKHEIWCFRDIDKRLSHWPSKIETYLDLLGGNNRLVPMFDRHSSNTRDSLRIII